VINEALKMIRVFHDLTQSELADKLGVSKSHVSGIESGRKAPSLELLQRYATVFDVPLSSIMFFSENLGDRSAADRARGIVAKKIVALMRFIAERSKNAEDM
jgi:transcriptional regulator with XRE-family HTH domain